MNPVQSFQEYPEMNVDISGRQQTESSGYTLSGEREGLMGYVILIAVVVIIVGGFIASLIYYKKTA